MKVEIRQETLKDHKAVSTVIQQAFLKEAYSDHKEHFLVERLRTSDSFVPELSLIAENEGRIVGYILLTKIKIKSEQRQSESLALAPVAVLPEYQGKGIGEMLIEKAHQKAKELGFESVVVLGHAGYYPKFGYKRADKYKIKLPFDAPEENCMVIELTEDALKHVQGTVEYPKEFYE